MLSLTCTYFCTYRLTTSGLGPDTLLLLLLFISISEKDRGECGWQVCKYIPLRKHTHFHQGRGGGRNAFSQEENLLLRHTLI